MPALPSDYDSDPDRWHSCDRGVQVFGDIHSPVARRIVGEDVPPSSMKCRSSDGTGR